MGRLLDRQPGVRGAAQSAFLILRSPAEEAGGGAERDDPSSEGTMGLFFKHLAVRLWAALLIGGLAALVVLPPFAGAVGPGWMVIPGAGLVALAYWLTGLVFGAMGRHRLDRLIAEATVWERAGMDREARQTLAQAEATVDSFYFSPFSRKVPAARLLAQMARMQLSQPTSESSSEALVGAYLDRFPRDREAAAKWLERMLAGGEATHRSHDIAARIDAAHPDDDALQQLLAQFYLVEGRCDFAALQTYRRLLDAQEASPGNLLVDLADLFLAHRRTDGLALETYLTVHQPENAPRLLTAGIAACCRQLPPTPLNRPLLNRADSALQAFPPAERRRLAATFLAEAAAAPVEPPMAAPRVTGEAFAAWLRRMQAGAGHTADRLAALANRIKVDAGRLLSARSTQTTVKWSAIGLLIAAVGWLVVSTTVHLVDDFEPVESAPEPAPAPVTDPFTLQVAAYLKEADAQRYVEQLKAKGLDAYWTRASGNNKTWYQVRVSHFQTKAQARAMGEDLKARKLIADYYVANYKRPDLP